MLIKKLLFILYIISSFTVLSNSFKIDIKLDSIPPQYKTGNVGLAKYLSKKLKKINLVPEKRIKNEKVKIKVFFIVEKDGSVTLKQVKNIDSLTKKSQKKLIMVFKKMPLWIPASIDGIPKKARMTQSITIN